MSHTYVDVHVAKKKMQLKNANFCLSFITTLWKGEVIMCCFNNLNKEMADIFCIQTIDSDDVIQLEGLVCDFIHGGNL